MNESENEIIELKLDEQNELLFKVKVVGTEQTPSAYRLVCEDSDISYCFNGEHLDEEDIVKFSLPSLQNKLHSGKVYDCAIEVLVENRYFRPVMFAIQFKETVKVVAESVQARQKTSVSVVAERKSNVANLAQKEKPTFQIKQIAKPVIPTPKAVVAPPRKTLQELHEKKVNATGIDEKVMEEVARSTMERLQRKLT